MQYKQALDSLYEVIFWNVTPKYKAVYYSSKALVSIITENYELALFENKNALNYDEIYVKAFHRRCSAHLALNLLDLSSRISRLF